MILKNITVKRFKALRGERTIDFSPGLNIIKGSDNEVGKSSLREAIVKALYQDPTTTKEEVTGLTNWGTDEPWEVELEFQDDSRLYQIVKSLKERSCKLVDLKSSKTITSKSAIADKIANITGCPLEIFFESTACIRQDELIRIIPQATTESEKQMAVGAISKRLQGTVAGKEGVDVHAIISRLYKKTHRKEAQGPYYQLKGITDRIQKLEPDKVSAEEKVNRVMENRRNLNNINEELREIDKDLPSKQDLFVRNEEIRRIEEEIERNKKQYENFKRAEKFKLKIERQNEELKEYACFKGAEEKIKQLQTIKENIKNLENQKFELQEKINTFKGQKPALWILVFGLILVVAGLIGLIITTYLGVVIITGVLLSAYWLISQKMWGYQIKTMTSGIEDLETPIQSTNKMRNILNGLGFENYDICLNKFKEYNKMLNTRKDTENMLKGTVGDKTWDEFEKENSDLDIQVRGAQKQLEKYLPFKIGDPLEFQKLEKNVEDLKKRKEKLNKEKSGLEKFFELTDVDTDQLAIITEELKGLNEERKFYERKKKIYDITKEALEESHTQTLSKATNILEEELGKYISTITSGKYSAVEIDEKDLSIWTISPEKKDKVNVLKLSRATQDQFYISARFALVKLITAEKKPPLLLDDPFVNFHQKRLEKMINLIQKLSKENQILLFTCSNAYDDYGKVISLD